MSSCELDSQEGYDFLDALSAPGESVRLCSLTMGFGPHALLLACLVDKLGVTRNDLDRVVVSAPKKGNGNVVRELKERLEKLAKSGPVVAVLDRDRIADLWKNRNDVQIQNGMCHQKHQLKNDHARSSITNLAPPDSLWLT